MDHAIAVGDEEIEPAVAVDVGHVHQHRLEIGQVQPIEIAESAVRRAEAPVEPAAGLVDGADVVVAVLVQVGHGRVGQIRTHEGHGGCFHSLERRGVERFEAGGIEIARRISARLIDARDPKVEIVDVWLEIMLAQIGEHQGGLLPVQARRAPVAVVVRGPDAAAQGDGEAPQLVADAGRPGRGAFVKPEPDGRFAGDVAEHLHGIRSRAGGRGIVVRNPETVDSLEGHHRQREHHLAVTRQRRRGLKIAGGQRLAQHLRVGFRALGDVDLDDDGVAGRCFGKSE